MDFSHLNAPPKIDVKGVQSLCAPSMLGVHLTVPEENRCAISLSRGIEMSGERRQVIDPDAELEAIMGVELPVELRGPTLVLPQFSQKVYVTPLPRIGLAWVTGFRDSGVQFIIERARHTSEALRGEISYQTSPSSSRWPTLDLDIQQLTLQS